MLMKARTDAKPSNDAMEARFLLTDIARTYGVSHTTIMRLTTAPDR